MAFRNSALITCLLMASTEGFVSGQLGPWGARGPKGIYANFLLNDKVSLAEAAAYPSGSSAYPNPAADAVLVKYFTTLLDNPAISGLAPQIPWYLLNPNDPGFDSFHPAKGAYTWNALDDVFIAVDQWNNAPANRGLPPKTIQLIISPGYNSPSWVFNNIDASVCGWKENCGGAGSCDGLFMTPAPVPAVSHQCGYTTLFWQVESGTPIQEQFPLPWNSVYKKDWQTFLVALNQHIQMEPASYAFDSIAMGGPTASSTEMILPNLANQKISPYPPNNPNPNSTNVVGGKAMLTLMAPGVVPASETAITVDVPTAWNTLFQNFYGSDPKYQNTDLPFIQEWDAVIDVYSQVFSGVTLSLTTTTDALPAFPVAASSPLLVAAPGFESDCGNDPTTDPNDVMACAAVTQVLAYYTNPFVGGNNAKLVFEAGMTAARDSYDLGTNGVKWLAATTAAGTAHVAGTPFRLSRILGGLQFSHTFSATKHDIQAEGCPTYPMQCGGGEPDGSLTPGEGLENVLSISFFPGTAVGPSFCAYTTGYGCGPTSVTNFGNFNYSDAPMNFLEIYDGDILYASGLSQCEMIYITGSPASIPPIPPNVSACQTITSDTLATQTELNRASQKLLSIAEPTGSW